MYDRVARSTTTDQGLARLTLDQAIDAVAITTLQFSATDGVQSAPGVSSSS